MEIGIDIETRSSESIKHGVYRYVESPDFTILLFSYSIDGSEPHIIDLTRQKLPKEVLSMLESPAWLKTAYNAQFERVCINKHFSLNIPASQWHCTLILAASVTLPLSLETCSKVLKVAEKDRKGKDLIRWFSIPIKKPKDLQVFRSPDKYPIKWESYKSYNIQDVKVETEIKAKLKDFLPYNEFERQIYLLDQKINDRGVKIDRLLVKNAIAINKHYTDDLIKQAKELTGIINPNSVDQLKAWIKEEIGLEVSTLNKEAVIKTDNAKVNKLLLLRKEMSKTSIKKYIAMYRAAIHTDDRVRGLFQMYGANRTRRWAGRIVQPQNYPKNLIKDLNFVRKIVKDNDLELLKMYAGDVNYHLSQLLRTSFIPEKGNTFLITDFKSIEACVLSWYAGETWKLEVFKTHGLIYEATASRMFNVPIESITKTSPERQKGKIAELALGYQGAAGALIKMGAEKMGIAFEDMQPIVDKWRIANRKIVKFWYDIDKYAKYTIENKCKSKLYNLVFEYKKGCLFIWLPSGRPVIYLNAKVTDRGITYMGMHQTKKKWMQLDTYGGKLVENIVQATARDLLGIAMLKIDKFGYDIVMHIHDEIVIEVPRGTANKDLEKIDKIMSEVPAWCEGLPLKGDSYLSDYYKKED